MPPYVYDGISDPRRCGRARPPCSDLLSVTCVIACEGGEVVPADDMTRAAVRWARLDQIDRGDVDVAVPAQPWLRRRALELYQLWRDGEIPPLDWRA